MFKDKVVVITGASRGIGREIALKFAGQGACVVLSARGEQSVAELAEDIRSGGGQALAVKGDVANGDDVDHLFALAVERKTQGFIGFFENLSRNGKITSKVIAHTGKLRTLSGKNKSEH